MRHEVIGAGHSTPRRLGIGFGLLLGFLSIASAIPVRSAAAPPTAQGAQSFSGRGVYYVDGAVRSLVGEFGSRSPFATNRIAIDDEHSTVQVDRAADRMVFRNEHRYGLNALVGCILLIGHGVTGAGLEVPAAVHLKIHKTLNRFRVSLHPHPTVREKLVSAVFEPFEVIVDNGKERKVVLSPEQTIEAVRDPQLMARLANIFMQVTDNLEDTPISAESPGAALVDISLGFGTKRVNATLARVRLLSNSAKNADLIRTGSVSRMLERGNWEFRVDSMSPYIPKWEFERQFFLFGIEHLSAIQQIARRGLLRGETLVVGYRDGRGYIGVGDRRSEIPNPADVARSYLEFHFVGGVISRQMSQLPARLE